MPQMKPMIWLMMMMMTLVMIMLTIIINFFSLMETTNQIKSTKIKSIKWKW
uniref:ATP synthase F0 subunit 8 n=1 Tax=Andrena nigroaenea TaxID=1126403 RepID=A0A0S2LT82_9HYME|nr:ATP synthase F0 subunit 8 [Andrena nigroaenea]